MIRYARNSLVRPAPWLNRTRVRVYGVGYVARPTSDKREINDPRLGDLPMMAVPTQTVTCDPGWVRGIEGDRATPYLTGIACKGCSSRCFPPFQDRQLAIQSGTPVQPKVPTVSTFEWTCYNGSPQCKVTAVSGPAAGTSDITRVGSVVLPSRCSQPPLDCSQLTRTGAEEPAPRPPTQACQPGYIRTPSGCQAMPSGYYKIPENSTSCPDGQLLIAGVCTPVMTDEKWELPAGNAVEQQPAQGAPATGLLPLAIGGGLFIGLAIMASKR